MALKSKNGRVCKCKNGLKTYWESNIVKIDCVEAKKRKKGIIEDRVEDAVY